MIADRPYYNKPDQNEFRLKLIFTQESKKDAIKDTTAQFNIKCMDVLLHNPLQCIYQMSETNWFVKQYFGCLYVLQKSQIIVFRVK